MSKPEQLRRDAVDLRYMAASKEQQAQVADVAIQTANQRIYNAERERHEALIQKRQALGLTSIFFF